MIQNLRSLAILAAVVENGSFRAAGTMLGLSASVVSHHISNLEKRLDCAIFHRTSRQLELTDKGVILHKAAREMVDVVNGGLNAISADDGEIRGSLRVSIPQVLSTASFLQTIEGFLAAYPKVSLDLHLSAPIVSALDTNYDVIITRCRSFDNSVSVSALTEISLAIVAAPDLVDKINRMPLSDVPGQVPFILAPGFSQLDWEGAFSNATGTNTRIETIRMKCDHLMVAHKMACSGGGVIALPEHQIIDDLSSGRLARVLPELTLPVLEFNAVYPRSAAKASLIWLFLDHILLEQRGAKNTGKRRKAG